MLGYDDHELENCREAWIQQIHPGDRKRVLAANQEHIVQKTPFYTAEYRLLCKDGSYRWFSDRAKALRDSSGNAIRIAGSIRDITASKQAESELQQLNQELEARVKERTAAAVIKSERRFCSLFGSAPDLLYGLDRQGVIQQVNLTQHRDITERKQADQERIQLLTTLEESERRWQSFLERVRLMVVGLDLEGRIDYVNPYFLECTGYSKEAALGSSWIGSFVLKSQRRRAQKIFKDILNYQISKPS